MRAHWWHCQSHLRGSCGGGGRESGTLEVEGVGLVVGREGGEMGIWGVKGEGGRARWEERKGVGVGDMDSVDRMVFFFLVRYLGGLEAPSVVVLQV